MNWSKTKTILIIALLITNAVMLGYLFQEHRQKTDAMVADRMIYQDVISVLASRDITVGFQGMPETAGVQAVEAAYLQQDVTEAAARLLPEGYRVKEGEGVAELGARSVTVSDGIRLLYRDEGLAASGDVLAEEEALETARKFLAEHGYDAGENARLSSIRNIGGDIEIVYMQQLGHRLIENGQMRLVISSQGVRSFEYSWLKILKVREMAFDIIPPGRALLKLSELIPIEAEMPPIVITSMTVGYRLDTDALNTHILSGDLSPYWRFATRTGVTYSVKALQ